MTGLLLSQARQQIETDPATRDLTLQIVESAPPFVSKYRAPVWGELRVLRATQTENTLELLVARELLGEEKPSAPSI